MVPVKLQPSKQWVERYEVASTSGGDPYVVSKKGDGTWGCSCPRWKFHAAPKIDCKHITATRQILERPLFRRPERKVETFFEDYSNNYAFRFDKESVLDFAEAFAKSVGTGVSDLVTLSPMDQTNVDGETYKITRKFRLNA